MFCLLVTFPFFNEDKNIFILDKYNYYNKIILYILLQVPCIPVDIFFNIKQFLGLVSVAK